MESEDSPMIEDDEDSSHSSSESVDEELKLNENFIEVLHRIELAKSYEDFILLVDIAHDLTDLVKIRQSIELFSENFPLSPEIWLRYLKVEAVVAQTEEELDKLKSLFQRALNDYFSIDVALEYANLAARCKDPKAKEIWEELIPAYGYEFTKGREVWAAWREDFMKREPDSPDKFRRVAKKFKEELLLPLSELQKTYTEFRDFIEEHGDQLKNYDRDSVEVEYKNTKQILQKVLPYEQRLNKLEIRSHQERVELFKSYINECTDDLEEEYVQVLYERMATACCLNESVWKEYISYIQNRSDEWQPVESNKSKIFKQTAIDIVERGLRNCNWSADLYVEKMRIYEADNRPRLEIQLILEEACTIQYNDSHPIVKIWLEYLSYLGRVTDYQDEKQKEILRSNFNLGWNTLGITYGNLADCDCEILKFWGRMEYAKLSDCNQGRQLWNTVMESNENYMKTALWQEFAQLEHHYRGIDAARLIFKRAVKINDLNDMQAMTSAWIRFERCYGSLDHLKYCQETCDKIMYHHRKRVQKRKFAASTQDGKDGKKDIKRKADDDHSQQQLKNKKAKESTSVSKEEFQKLAISKSKQEADSEGGEVDTSKDNVRVFFSNLDYNVTTEDLKEAFPEITIVNFNVIKTPKGNSRGFGYAELSSEVDVQKALSMDRRMLAGRPVFISRCERDKSHRGGFKYSTSVEPNKIFIKGLAFEANNEDLKRLFSEFGAVRDARIVMQKNGKSKGIAYIEFEEDKSASLAVMKMDQKEFMNRTLSVAISAPPTTQTVKPAYIASLGGNRKPQGKNEQKSRISFIPASVQKASASSTTRTEAPTAKSNDDFRKMLLK